MFLGTLVDLNLLSVQVSLLLLLLLLVILLLPLLVYPGDGLAQQGNPVPTVKDSQGFDCLSVPWLDILVLHRLHLHLLIMHGVAYPHVLILCLEFYLSLPLAVHNVVGAPLCLAVVLVGTWELDLETVGWNVVFDTLPLPSPSSVLGLVGAVHNLRHFVFCSPLG